MPEAGECAKHGGRWQTAPRWPLSQPLSVCAASTILPPADAILPPANAILPPAPPLRAAAPPSPTPNGSSKGFCACLLRGREPPGSVGSCSPLLLARGRRRRRRRPRQDAERDGCPGVGWCAVSHASVRVLRVAVPCRPCARCMCVRACSCAPAVLAAVLLFVLLAFVVLLAPHAMPDQLRAPHCNRRSKGSTHVARYLTSVLDKTRAPWQFDDGDGQIAASMGQLQQVRLHPNRYRHTSQGPQEQNCPTAVRRGQPRMGVLGPRRPAAPRRLPAPCAG